MKNINIEEMFAKFPAFDNSPEAKEKRLVEKYDTSKVNPENMSYWLNKIEVSTSKDQSALQVPATKIVTIPYEWWKWLQSDLYTAEKTKEFNDFLLENLGTFLPDKTLFMKTGVFSNKFDFKLTVVTDREKIGQQFLDIYYASMCLGPDNTNEAVFREMVADTEGRETIYNGMPLHTEFRIFYDFDTKELVGTANYWHPEVMNRYLSPEDSLRYTKEESQIVTDYNQYKKQVAEEVAKFMDGVTGLSGKWSVDVMKNGDDYWLIDMARMERSALVQQMESLS